MPDEEKVKQEDLVDVGETEGAEIELDKKAEGGEVKDEKPTQDSDKSDDTPEKLDESVDVRDSKDDKEPEKKEEELEDYSKGVKSRIAKLTKRMREAERQREAALTYAKSVQGEQTSLKDRLAKLDTGYVKEMEDRITSSVTAAQSKLQAAREANDINAEVLAQKDIAKLGYEEARLAEMKVQQKQQEEQRKTLSEGTIPQAPLQPTPDAQATEWAQKNAWFGKDNAMTYTAFDLHRKLTEEEGYDPKSDSYYQEIDKRIRLEFPQKFGNTVEKTISKPTQNVASATRSARAGRKSVKLTPSQVAIAKKLRVPLEEYARQLRLTEGE